MKRELTIWLEAGKWLLLIAVAAVHALITRR